MTLSPEFSRLVAARIREVYQEAEDRVLGQILQSISKGLDSSDWAARKSRDLNVVMATIDTYLSRLDEATPSMISRAVVEAYQAGQRTADVDLRAAGRDPVGGYLGSHAVDALSEDSVRSMSDMKPRVLRETADVYQKITADTASQVLTGSMTRREASREAVRRYLLEGVKPFRDKSGRRWEMGAYAEMSVRTTAGQAAVLGHTDQLQALGHDLVIVSTSHDSCDVCAPWEGKVLSISGSTTGQLSDGVRVAGSISRARAAGLQHPNCNHSVGIYLPGRTRPHTTDRDPEESRMRQKHRAKERGIRKAKREVLIDEQTMGKNSVEAKMSRKKLRQKQAEFKAWREEHDRKNLTYRTNLTAR